MYIYGKMKSNGDDVSDARDVWLQVFHIDGNVEKAELAIIENASLYTIIYENNIPIAMGALTIINNKRAVINSIAVLTEKRGQKIGDMTARMLIDQAFRDGIEEIALDHTGRYSNLFKEIGFQIKDGVHILDKNHFLKPCQ